MENRYAAGCTGPGRKRQRWICWDRQSRTARAGDGAVAVLEVMFGVVRSGLDVSPGWGRGWFLKHTPEERQDGEV
jgi:hypothetical protein